MTTVILALHLIITAVLIFVILLQKTEGNAAGGGFSATASLSSMMQPRARPNALTRTTAILAAGFFVTSIALALLARNQAPPTSVMTAPEPGSPDVPRVSDSVEAPPSAPSADAPAAPAAPAAPPAVPNN